MMAKHDNFRKNLNELITNPNASKKSFEVVYRKVMGKNDNSSSLLTREKMYNVIKKKYPEIREPRFIKAKRGFSELTIPHQVEEITGKMSGLKVQQQQKPKPKLTIEFKKKPASKLGGAVNPFLSKPKPKSTILSSTSSKDKPLTQLQKLVNQQQRNKKFMMSASTQRKGLGRKTGLTETKVTTIKKQQIKQARQQVKPIDSISDDIVEKLQDNFIRVFGSTTLSPNEIIDILDKIIKHTHYFRKKENLVSILSTTSSGSEAKYFPFINEFNEYLEFIQNVKTENGFENGFYPRLIIELVKSYQPFVKLDLIQPDLYIDQTVYDTKPEQKKILPRRFSYNKKHTTIDTEISIIARDIVINAIRSNSNSIMLLDVRNLSYRLAPLTLSIYYKRYHNDSRWKHGEDIENIVSSRLIYTDFRGIRGVRSARESSLDFIYTEHQDAKKYFKDVFLKNLHYDVQKKIKDAIYYYYNDKKYDDVKIELREDTIRFNDKYKLIKDYLVDDHDDQDRKFLTNIIPDLRLEHPKWTDQYRKRVLSQVRENGSPYYVLVDQTDVRNVPTGKSIYVDSNIHEHHVLTGVKVSCKKEVINQKSITQVVDCSHSRNKPVDVSEKVYTKNPMDDYVLNSLYRIFSKYYKENTEGLVRYDNSEKNSEYVLLYEPVPMNKTGMNWNRFRNKKIKVPNVYKILTDDYYRQWKHP